jgi:radical SAM superfamily enzyme YgiQ (UPF0313 family)
VTEKPLLIYPDRTDIAVSNLAVHWFFNAFNEFEPDLLTSDSKVGIFHKRDINKTPFVFVSLSYGPDIIKFAKILRNSGIPLRKEDREKGMFPLFICGGIAALLNPEPLTLIFDAVFLGEGECMKDDIVKMFSMETREGVLDHINALEYAMTDVKPDARQVIAAGGSFFVSSNEILHKLGNCFGNRKIVEMNRGCTSRCRFCAASYAYRTFREPDGKKLMDFVKKTAERKEGLALMGTSLADVSSFDEILETCAASGCTVSLSSLKITEINEKRALLLKKCGVRTVTVAVESADPDTRQKILKNITDTDIFNAMEILKKHNLKAKIYLIAGFPETDLQKEAESVIELLKELDKRNLLHDVTISVAPLSPKPLTPLQDAKFMDKKQYKNYMVALKKGCSVFGKRIKLDFFSYRESEIDYKTGFLKGADFIDLINENIEKGDV